MTEAYCIFSAIWAKNPFIRSRVASALHANAEVHTHVGSRLLMLRQQA